MRCSFCKQAIKQHDDIVTVKVEKTEDEEFDISHNNIEEPPSPETECNDAGDDIYVDRGTAIFTLLLEINTAIYQQYTVFYLHFFF